MKATLIGSLAGRRVYRFPVEVLHNDSRACATIARKVIVVIAHTAADAANAIKDTVDTIPETEITAYGPKGGRAAYRYVGWESAIWRAMIGSRASGLQTSFNFGA